MIEEAFSEIFQRLIWTLLVCLPFVAIADVVPPAANSSSTPAAEIAPAAEAVASYQLMTNLTFDAETQEFRAKAGEATATFLFHVTNASDVPVHIISINPSCSCTKAELPETPWVLLPYAHGEFHAVMALVGKPPGETVKGLTIVSTNGIKQVFVKSILPAPDAMSDRLKNQELAKADRQAVFRNDCAACHVEKGRGLMGAALYKEACGICHDSEHRATMVPDLGSLNRPTDAAYWRTMIADGKDNTLMPAFSGGRGGPLSAEQIDSLVEYMIKDFPREHKPTTQVPLPPAAATPNVSSAPPSMVSGAQPAHP